MGAIATHYANLGLNNSGFKKGLDSSGKMLGNFKSAITKIGATLGIAFGVEKLVSFGIEASKLAGQAEGISAAFGQLNQPGLLDEMRSAVRGTIDDMTLMKAAVRAKNFKIPLEKLGTFFKFATDRAAQTGESVDYLVNSIIDGIGRKSTLVMDNLGISAAELQSEIKKTGDFGLAAGKIIEQSMASSGKVADTTAMKTARWGATMKNIQVTIGTGLNKVLQALAPYIDQAFQAFTKYLPDIQRGLVDIINYFIDLYNESIVFRGAINLITATFKTMWDNTKLVFILLWDSLKTSGTLIKQIFTGDFSGALETWKNGFTILATDVKDHAKKVAQNYVDAYNATLTPKKKIELISFTTDQVAAAVMQSGNAAEQIATGLTSKLESLFSPEAGKKESAPEFGPKEKDPISGMDERFGMLISNMQGYMAQAGGYLTSFFEGFASAFTSGEDILKQFLDYFKKWAIGIIAQILAIAAAAALLSIITGGSFSGIFKGLFNQGGGFGGFLQGAKGLKGAGAAGSAFGTVLKGEDIYTSYNRFALR